MRSLTAGNYQVFVQIHREVVKKRGSRFSPLAVRSALSTLNRLSGKGVWEPYRVGGVYAQQSLTLCGGAWLTENEIESYLSDVENSDQFPNLIFVVDRIGVEPHLDSRVFIQSKKKWKWTPEMDPPEVSSEILSRLA